MRTGSGSRSRGAGFDTRSGAKGNGRERIAEFIDDAKHSIFLQNERYQDAVIIERLVRAQGAA